VDAAKAFTFNVRIPAWAQTSGHSTIVVGDAKAQALKVDKNTSIQAVSIRAGITKFTINLDMPLIVEKGINNSVAIFRGPLFYAIDLAHADQAVSALRYHALFCSKIISSLDVLALQHP
jgi:DUF1680 family protein